MRASLGEISEIQVGYQSRAGIRSHSDGSHCIIQARDFDKLHQIDWTDLTRFTPSESVTKSEIRLGDVLFLAKGQDNFAYLINHEVNNILAANSFYIIRTNPKNVLPNYLAWWLNQAPAQEYIRSNRSGSSLPFLSVSALMRLKVSIPDMRKQQTIGEMEVLRRKEMDLLNLYITKKSVLIQAICLNAVE